MVNRGDYDSFIELAVNQPCSEGWAVVGGVPQEPPPTPNVSLAAIYTPPVLVEPVANVATVDFNLSDAFVIQLSANTIVVFINQDDGMGGKIFVEQTGAGGFTLGWPNTIYRAINENLDVELAAGACTLYGYSIDNGRIQLVKTSAAGWELNP